MKALLLLAFVAFAATVHAAESDFDANIAACETMDLQACHRISTGTFPLPFADTNDRPGQERNKRRHRFNNALVSAIYFHEQMTICRARNTASTRACRHLLTNYKLFPTTKEEVEGHLAAIPYYTSNPGAFIWYPLLSLPYFYLFYVLFFKRY